MEKSTTLNLRVNPVVKQQAEDVLKQYNVKITGKALKAADSWQRFGSKKTDSPQKADNGNNCNNLC